MRIIKLNSGFITSPNPSSVIKSYKLFGSGNGGNCFVLVTKLNKTIASDPAWEVYANFLDEEAQNIFTYLIYQSQVDYFNLNLIFCRNSNGEGYNCLMQVETITPIQATTTKMYYLLTFLTTGSVINNKKVNIGTDAKTEILSISVLFNGGFLVIY